MSLSTIERWSPTSYTPTLTGTEDFCTDGDRLIRVVEKYWQAPEVEGKFELDDWQKWLIRHILERYPCGDCESCVRLGRKHPHSPGVLRFRQVLASMGRQNGKSVLGGIFGFYGLLMHEPGPQVIGLASNKEQAEIIYERVYHVIKENNTFTKKVKATGTRGISRRDGTGTYRVKPAKGDALQGIPISMCLFDEVHISKEDMWQAVVNGLRTRKNGMVLGITTAGDDTSALLKSLYKTGGKSVAGDEDAERFGFFLWEAPEGSSVEDDEAIMAANPAVACGRVDLATVKSDVRNLPEPDQQRYVLNRFVASVNNWLPMTAWNKTAGQGIPQGAGPITFSIDRTPDWEYASIVATVKHDGKVYSELVASMVKPNLDQLVKVCVNLRKHGPIQFAVDSYQLGELSSELKRRGFKVYCLSQKEIVNACATAYALIVQDKFTHDNQPLLRQQMPRAVRKNIGEGWRISRKDSSVEIDAVMATVMGVYVSENTRGETVQMFV